jgi:hypothetical protein
MRSTTDVPVAGIRNDMAPNTFIPKVINLSMTIKARNESKNPVKYRAIRRSDGVIVEQPRYRPSTSPLQQLQTVPKASESPTMLAVARKHETLIRKINEDLAAIGSSWEAMSSACIRGRSTNSGRDRYNRPSHNERESYNKEDATVIDNKLMLERYLATDGPWCVYELREQ